MLTWYFVYQLCVVIALQFGVLSGPRIRFDLVDLPWLSLVTIPGALGLAGTALVLSFPRVPSLLVHCSSYLIVVTTLLLANLISNWAIEVSLSFILLHIGFGSVIHAFEISMRITRPVVLQP
jgi:hypothetical protein